MQICTIRNLVRRFGGQGGVNAAANLAVTPYCVFAELVS